VKFAAEHWQKYCQVEIEVEEQLIVIKDTTHNLHVYTNKKKNSTNAMKM